jgi:putative ABC transport system substrate-binding protein
MRHFRSLLLLGLLFAAFALPAVAQGYTVSFNQIVEHPALDAVRKGVQDALADEHLDVSYNVHIAQGNISTANLIARQILGENPDVIVPIATPTAQACAQITRDKPIVFAVVSDPVGAGLVKSFDHPGANITGTSDMSPVDKQLELALKIVPGIQRIGVIYNSGESNSVAIVNVLKKDAAARQMTVVEATVANSAGVYPAAKSLVGKVDAIYIPTDNTVVSAFEPRSPPKAKFPCLPPTPTR